ncbi:Putative uncharacterized protein [Pseudomonas putida]|uniref:Uncharacterized protein n=1 Tax=Pseudomonas putida TaxID=303 RepID=A0A1L7NDZ8_PSEPU|nr:Putative uncharacterized protein [Pseudomonas putida]
MHGPAALGFAGQAHSHKVTAKSNQSLSDGSGRAGEEAGARTTSIQRICKMIGLLLAGSV